MSSTSRLVLPHLKASISVLTPLSLAETSWDNVGVMAEAPFPRHILAGKQRIVTCIDLTEQVTEAALADPQTVLILVYHPPIFSGLKKLTLDTSLQRSLLRSIAKGVSIFCLHTAADNALGGVNDFIAARILVGDDEVTRADDEGVAATPTRSERIRAITPAIDPPLGHEGAGSGRIVDLSHLNNGGLLLSEIAIRIKRVLNLDHLQIARSSSRDDRIRTVAICAGSGSGVLKNVEADLYLTGEFGHHDILLANAQGRHVITCNHSATERPWLKAFGPRLAKSMNDAAGLDSLPYEVVHSELDREPLELI